MFESLIHRSPRAVALVGIALLTLGTTTTTAGAATVTTTTVPRAPGGGRGGPPSAFCTQLQQSQTAIAAVPATAKDRYARIAGEWTKLATAAPTQIKTDVTAIQVAYTKAGTQAAADATKTLGTITAAGQRVSTYAAANCGPGVGGGGGAAIDPAAFQAYRDCMVKQGIPADQVQIGRGRGGQAPTATTVAGAKDPRTDPKYQAARTACRSKLPNGGAGGPGGGLGGANFQKLQDCLKKKGVTLPAGGGAPGAAGGQGGGGGGGGPQVSFDAKTQAAMDACRKELGIPARPAQ